MARRLLSNSFSILLRWGLDFIQLYNDACIPVLGDKHPGSALGKPFQKCWAEVYHVLGPLAEKPFHGGGRSRTSGRCVWNRRMRGFVFAVGEPGGRRSSVAARGMPPERADRADTPFRLEIRPRAGRPLGRPAGHGGSSSDSIAVCSPASRFPIAGVSSRLRFDDAYKGFLDLASAQIAATVANARAREMERRRNEALAEIDRAKTTFFSNISHELRTPLTLSLVLLKTC